MLNHQYFVKSVYSLDQLPEKKLPEVVLCGRSNVGKSSFINSIFNKKNLAKTSATPGKTRSINYYSVDDVFYVVDLPGYGFAKTSLEERKKWQFLIDKFLKKSEQLEFAFHLIDCRHDPTELDIKMNNLFKVFCSLSETIVAIVPPKQLKNNAAPTKLEGADIFIAKAVVIFALSAII